MEELANEFPFQWDDLAQSVGSASGYRVALLRSPRSIFIPHFPRGTVCCLLGVVIM